jgi:hypothetical protein
MSTAVIFVAALAYACLCALAMPVLCRSIVAGFEARRRNH